MKPFKDETLLKVGKGLDLARLSVVVLALLAVVWLQDPEAADTLAPKFLWFGVVGGLLPALTVLRLWWGAPLRFPPRSIALALLAWCACLTVSFLASPLRDQARLPWQAGLLSVLIYAAAVDLMVEEGGRTWFLRGLVAASGLAGARSLAQRLGLDASPLALAEQADFGHRVAGCFGNPNFAGGFFCLVLPVLAHQALVPKDKAWRYAAWAAFVLSLLGLALSSGKAALLGALFSLALAAHLLFWSKAEGPQKRRAFAWLASAAGLGLVLGALFLPADSLQRLAGGPKAWSESVAFRKVTWEGTLDLGAARPLLGWGPGTFSAAYPAFRRPEAMAVQQQHSYEVTAPENWLLQFFAEGGALGAAAILLVLGILLWPLGKAARDWASDPEGAGLCLALLCSLAACLACNLASLDLFLPTTLLPFLLLLALGTALTAGQGPAVSLNPENYARALVSVSLAFMASVPMVEGVLQAQASRLLAKGRGLSQAGRFSEAVPDYELALQFDDRLLEAKYFLGTSLLDLGGDTAVAKAAEAFEDLRRYAPDYVRLHAELGRLYAAQGKVPEAAQEYERQLALDPWDLEAVRDLATLYAESGHLAEAENVLADAALRWPENGDIARNLATVQMARIRAERGGKR